jgi:hypothetical protein
MSAKSVCLLSLLDPNGTDKAYQELKKWGRFQITAVVVSAPRESKECSSADIIIRLEVVEAGTQNVAFGNTTANTTLTGYGNTATATTTVHNPVVIPIRVRDTYLGVFEGGTETKPVMWYDAARGGSSNPKDCIKELRKRIEAQEKSAS